MGTNPQNTQRPTLQTALNRVGYFECCLRLYWGLLGWSFQNTYDCLAQLALYYIAVPQNT